MQAVRMLAPGSATVTDVRVPQCGPRQVLLEPRLAGVCATDLHVLFEDRWHSPLPITLGHEFFGVVTEVGHQVVETKPGDTVAVEPVLPCGECEYCRRGQWNLCGAMSHLGIFADGCYAERVVVPADRVTVLPSDITDIAAAMLEPLACAVNFLDKAEIRPGEVVLIVGGGPIGLMTTLLVRAVGARPLLSEPESVRRALALKCGADRVIDPGDREALHLATKAGVDVAIECVGNGGAINDALHAVKRGGRVVLTGNGSDPVSLDASLIVAGEIIVRGANATRWQMPRAVALIQSGCVDPSPVVTAIYPLSETVDALELAHQRKDIGKLLIHVSGPWPEGWAPKKRE